MKTRRHIALLTFLFILAATAVLSSCSGGYTATQILSFRSAPFSFDADVFSSDGKTAAVVSGEYKSGVLTLRFSSPAGLENCTLKTISDGSFILEMPDGILLPMPYGAIGGAADLFDLLTLDGGQLLQGKRVTEDGEQYIRAVFEQADGTRVTLFLSPETMLPARIEKNGMTIVIKG